MHAYYAPNGQFGPAPLRHRPRRPSAPRRCPAAARGQLPAGPWQPSLPASPCTSCAHADVHHPILQHTVACPLHSMHPMIGSGCKLDRLALPFFCSSTVAVETGRRSAPPVGAWPRCTLGRPRAQKKKAAHRESRWKGVGVARCAGLLLAVIRSVRLRLFGARAEASAGEETEAPSVPGPQPKWRRFRLIPSQRPPPR